MILKNYSTARCYGLFLLLASALSAAPRLNLNQTAFPVLVAQGSNGPTQVADAFNIGDGELSLTASSDSTWLVPTVSPVGLCGLRGGCTPISMALNTASLASGTYTGTVTLSDPSAVDAPQFITVTVAVGGNVPSKLEYYLAPGGSVSAAFATGSEIKAAVSANTAWLAVTVNKSGGATVTLTAASSMAASDYNGTITFTNSTFAPDNKQVPVLLHVTTQPILHSTASTLNFKIAQGANKQSIPVGVSNAGQGTLTVSGVTATPASGTWLTAATVTGGITITADPTGLMPNTYPGTVTIASNADNSSVVIQVQLTVLAQTPPVVFAAGAVNIGDFGSNESVAQGDIVAVFGQQFTYGDPQAASNLPLGNTLGDVQVLLNGSPVPLYYAAPGQINIAIPLNAATGDGLLQVTRSGQAGNQIYINVSSRAPRFLTGGGQYAIITTGGTLNGIPSHPAKVGDTLVIYAVGLGTTVPSVTAGTASPSNPLAEITPTSRTQVCFGVPSPFAKVPCTTPEFVGLTPTLAGLYQVNVKIPSGTPSGTTLFIFLVDNNPSDVVQLVIQ